MDLPTLFTTIMTTGTLLGNLVLLGLLLFFLIRRSIFDSIMRWVGARALLLGLLVSFAATVGSLIYSEVVGFPACILCWIQRIFMYPLLPIFGLALWRKEAAILPYTFFLSLLGFLVSLYQWAKDMLALYGSVNLACPEVAGLPSCDKIFVLEYGYVTIPFISLTAFVFLLLISWAGMRERSEV